MDDRGQIPQRQTAPDGGPITTTKPKHQPVPTMSVKLRGGDRTIIINAADFDAGFHIKVKPKARKLTETSPSRKVSRFEEFELRKMTLAKLRKLPEFSYIDEPAKRRDELVDQILATREAA